MSVSKDLRRRKYSCTNFRLHQVIHSCRHDAHQKSWCCIICPATRMGSQELSGVGNKRLSNCTMWGRKGHLNLHCNKNVGVLRILFLQFTSTALNLLFFTGLLQNIAKPIYYFFLYFLNHNHWRIVNSKHDKCRWIARTIKVIILVRWPFVLHHFREGKKKCCDKKQQCHITTLI